MAGACSGDEPSIFEARDPVDVTSVVAVPSARWGTGYAVAAHPIADGRTAVVTSAGIYITDGSDDAPQEVEAFAGSTQAQTTAVSSDGSVLVLATSSPAALRWYDLTTGAPTASVDLGVEGLVRELAFVPSTTSLVTVTGSGLSGWNASTPDAPPTTLAAEPIGDIAVTDGRVVAPVLGTSDVVLTDGTTVDRRTLQLAEGATVLGAKASVDGSVLAVTSGTGPNEFDRVDTVNIVDPASIEVVGAIEFARALRPLEWAVTPTALATANGDELSITTLSGEPITAATPLPGDAVISVLPTDVGLATVHQSGNVVSWPAPDWSPAPLGQSTVALRFAQVNGADVMAVDFDGTITQWTMADGARRDDDRFASGEATATAISSDGGSVAVATAAGRALILDDQLVEQATLVVDGRSPHIDTVEFNPETKQVVTGLAERLGDTAFDDSVTLWDEDGLAPSVTIGGESEDVAGCSFFYNRVDFTPDGSLMSTVSHDFSVAVHDGLTGDYIVTLEPFASTVLDTDFSLSGDLLVAASDDASVRVWDTEDFEQLASYVSSPGGLQAFELMPDDSTLIASDLSGRLIVMDLMSGEVLDEIAQLGARSPALALSHDGGLVAAPMSDGTVGIWSTTSGTLLATLTGHAGPVTDIEFARDDEWIVTTSRDGTVRKWDIDTTTA